MKGLRAFHRWLLSLPAGVLYTVFFVVPLLVLLRMSFASSTNHKIELEAPDRARGEAYFLVVTDRGVDHWGRYRDEYRRENERWRFAHRRAKLDGFAPDSWTAERRRAAASSPAKER